MGAVATDDTGRLLVIRRGHAPAAGTWSIPGGRVEPGETDAEALIREMAEETGLRVAPREQIGTVDRDGPPGVVYEIHDYRVDVLDGHANAASDAADLRWVTPAELVELPCAPLLVETLREWRVLPEPPT